MTSIVDASVLGGFDATPATGLGVAAGVESRSSSVPPGRILYADTVGIRLSTLRMTGKGRVLILGSSRHVKVGYDAISDGEKDKRSQSVDREGGEGMYGWGNTIDQK
jgi:hypothetical protein